MSNHDRMINLNNANVRKYDDRKERNVGAFGTNSDKYDDRKERNVGAFGTNSDNATFESWACESFNLFEFLGEDTSPFDEVVPEKLDEDEIEKQKEDAMYSQFQYSDMLIGGQHPSVSQHDFGANDFGSVPTDGCSDYDVPNTFRDETAFSIHPSSAQQIYSHEFDTTPYIASTSKSSMPVVKQEPISEQEQQAAAMKEDLETPKCSRESSVTSGYMQLKCYKGGLRSSIASLRPRKYRIKPESEKQNPLYRMKRQKNNDAVRRSRDKAKRVQEAKESELQLLQEDNYRKDELIETLKASNIQLKGENLLLRQNCRCGAVLRLPKR